MNRSKSGLFQKTFNIWLIIIIFILTLIASYLVGIESLLFGFCFLPLLIIGAIILGNIAVASAVIKAKDDLEIAKFNKRTEIATATTDKTADTQAPVQRVDASKVTVPFSLPSSKETQKSEVPIEKMLAKTKPTTTAPPKLSKQLTTAGASQENMDFLLKKKVEPQPTKLFEEILLFIIKISGESST